MDRKPVDPAWKHFGKILRSHRERLNLRQIDVAGTMGVVGSYYSAWETGRRKVDEKFVNALDKNLKAGGRIAEAWQKAQSQIKSPLRFAELPELEGNATQLREFNPWVLSGLLQTEDYARAVFQDSFPGMPPHGIEELVQTRMARQKILRDDSRPLVFIILAQAVLHQQVGGRGAGLLQDQRRRVLQEMESGKVRVQILPHDTGHHYGNGGPFRLYTFADEPPVASAEYMTGEVVISNKDRHQECVTTFGLLQGEAHSESASLRIVQELVGR
ncbi:Scr1 family TA system antitoxin-like transcriptional regulator [Nocardiopsis flavescens]|uniref:helix-turn-helix domain-containing protein n=1 Tax=Nocardiopsis flavescens TaxID=758803 RepID=UPI00364968D7